MEGLMAFCEWAFGNWPIRWLYAHSFEHNVGAFESGLRRGEAVRLGVLRERMVVCGELTDVHVIGIERDAWLASPLRRRFNQLRARQPEPGPLPFLNTGRNVPFDTCQRRRNPQWTPTNSIN
jgi:hypothetical protein